MSLKVLEVVQRVCARSGMQKPAAAVASSDGKIITMIGLLGALSEDLDTRRQAWFNANWVVDGATAVLKRYITRDDDTFAMPDGLPLNWLRWRWKAEKGLEYAEDFAMYERQVGMLLLTNHGQGTIDMARGTGRAYSVRNINQAPWLLQQT